MNSWSRALAVAGVCSLYFVPFAGVPVAAVAQSSGRDESRAKQAWVFDGSADAAATYQIALDGEGFLAEMSARPNCATRQRPSTLPDMIVTLFRKGITQPSSPAFSFDANIFPRPPGPTPSPFDPSRIETDCDALGAFAQVQAYLAQEQAQALQLQAEVGNCLQSANALECQLHDLVTHAHFNPDSSFGTCKFGFAVDPDSNNKNLSDGTCGACALALFSVPQLIDTLQLELSSCTAAKNQLATDITLAQQIISSQSVACWATQAAFESDGLELQERAEGSYSLAGSVVTALNGVAAQCTLDKVTAGCTACSPGRRSSSGPSDPGPAAGHGPSLDRLAQAFRLAAARASDPAAQTHLWDVAVRLERLPEHRVQRATFKTASSIGQELVALRSPDLPDDGVSPLAIVLTELDHDAPSPRLTPADQRQLLDAMQAFYDVVHVTTRVTTPGR
jgi:hypothetical protein